MSRFNKLAHSIWHCHYHVVWTPKYRFRILKDEVKKVVEQMIKLVCEQLKCKIVELNVQIDHVHILLAIPPKHKISEVIGEIKGRIAIRVLNLVPELRKRYWGNHFWARGYCIDTVELNFEMIRNYVKYQEKKERQLELKNIN